MGWIRHQGIVVTGYVNDGYCSKPIDVAHDKAVEMGLLVSAVIKGTSNGYASFLVAPDGSKEGWKTSDEFDAKRKHFIAWLRSDNDRYYDWFEYAADSDNAVVEITDTNMPDTYASGKDSVNGDKQ